MSETNSPKHVFWLGRTERWAMGQLSQLRLLTVDDKVVTFDGISHQVTIALQEIERCKPHVVRQRYIHNEHVHIKLKPKELLLSNYSAPTQYYLAAANPLTLKVDNEFAETRLLVEVINAYLSGKSIGVQPNPYYREFERLKKLDYFVEAEWNAFVSPNEYAYRKLPKKLKQRAGLDNQFTNQFIGWIAAMWLFAIFVIMLFLGYWAAATFIGVLILMIVLLIAVIHWQNKRLSVEQLNSIAEADRSKDHRT